MEGTPDLRADLRDGLPIESNSCDGIAAIHVLEHFGPHEATFVLGDWHRVLKPGGVLRLVVPDLSIFANAYVSRDSSFYNLPGPCDGLRFPGETYADRFMYALRGQGHQLLYDAESAQAALQRAGFAQVRRCSYREGLLPDLDVIDSRPEVSLYMEATKSAATQPPPAESLRIGWWRAKRKAVDETTEALWRLRSALRVRTRIRRVLRARSHSEECAEQGIADIVRTNTVGSYDTLFSVRRHLDDYLSESRLQLYQEIANRCAELGARDVLDAGCGSGDFLRVLQRRLAFDGRSARMRGIDLSPGAVARAKSTLPDASFSVADIEAIPCGPGAFDLVVALEVLEHVQSPQAVLIELMRVCKAGGTLLVSVPDGEVDHFSGHVNFWTRDELTAYLSPLGAWAVERLASNPLLVATMKNHA